MDYSSFIKTQYPLCMGLPFYKALVQNNLYFKLVERSEVDFSGRNLFDQQCPNARICDDSCLGRPIPKYPELEPILRKYDLTEGTWNGQEVWFLKVDTCKTCPFKGDCTKMCPAMSAFDKKNSNLDDYKLEMATPLELMSEEWAEELFLDDEEEGWFSQLNISTDDIAWDCLSEAQQAAILLVQVQGKTYEQAAELRGVAAKNIHKAHLSGMDRLKEFGLARIALRSDTSCKYAIEYYRGGLTLVAIAEIYCTSKDTVQRRIKEFKEKHGISS